VVGEKKGVDLFDVSFLREVKEKHKNLWNKLDNRHLLVYDDI
jgi:hypothetical protein